MKLLKRVLFFIAACMATAHVHAADAYYEFVADIYLLQSQQLRNPKATIAYGDGKSGELLESVLTPTKFVPQLEYYFKAVARSPDKSLPNLIQAIKPVIDRYDAAFKANPKKYENEYLDGMEDSVQILIGSNKLLEQSASAQAPASATVEQKKIAEAAEKMRDNVKSMSAAVTRNLAETLRKRAEQGEFSAEGTKRVLALANRLQPK